MKARRITAAVSVTALVGLGNPMSASLLPPAARAASRMVCQSANFDYSYCRVDTRQGVRLIQQLSRSPCIQGRTWGTDRGGIWVDHGCAAQFSVSNGASAGTVVGAAVIGGIVGALLSSSGSSDHRYSDSDRAPKHYQHDYRDDDPSPYDRYGNSNYDRKGRYDGCHGLGCTVDRPEEHDTSQDVDPTVHKFDKDGNPNYDEHGGYIGGHGIGTQVDNPDPPSDGGDSSQSSEDPN